MMGVTAGLMDNTQTKKAYHLTIYLTQGNILFFYTPNGERKNTIMKFTFLFSVINEF